MSTIEALDYFRTSSHNPSFYEIQSKTSYKGELLDFCIPVNSYFPPPKLVEMIRGNLVDILKYYPDYAILIRKTSLCLQGSRQKILSSANGSTEIITVLCRDINGPMVTSIPTSVAGQICR